MKKLFCTSFLLFATTLSFSAPAGKTDTVAHKRIDLKIYTTTNDMPIPVFGCSKVPKDCQ